MAEANCHYCARPATSECHTCGRLYCGEHGEDVCLRCLSPEAATPSPMAFRGAVLALIVGTAVTIFLVVSPPESASKADSVRPITTPTITGPATATPTRAGGTASRTSTTATASGTASASAATPASGTATPAGQQSYTVEAGDSVSKIAEKFGVTQQALRGANPGLTDVIQIGQVLRIPAR